MKYPQLEHNEYTEGSTLVKLKIKDQIWTEKRMSAGERILALYLFDQDIDRDGVLWRTPEQISTDLGEGFSPRNVKRLMNTLEKKEFITRAFLVSDKMGRRSKAKAIILNTNLLMKAVGEDPWEGCPYQRISKGISVSVNGNGRVTN